MKNIGLFLDDIREPKDKPSTIEEWIVVKNYKEFISFIEEYYKTNKSLPYLISLDHDLHTEHYVRETKRNIGSPIFYSNYREKTGKDCVEWLCIFCANNGISLDNKIAVHSENTMGNGNMMFTLNKFIKDNKFKGIIFEQKWNYESKD